MGNKDFILKIPYMELIDKRTYSKRKYNNVSIGLLRDLDLKFNFGIFVPDKELFKELDEKVEKKEEKTK